MTGVSGGALAYWLVHSKAMDDVPMVVVAEDSRAAKALADNLSFFYPAPDAVVHFPSYEMGVYDEVVPDKTSSLRRLSALFHLGKPNPSFRFVVLTPDVLARKLLPRTAFFASVRELSSGDWIEREELIAFLDQGGYHHCAVVEEPGTYSVRGALVDLYVPSMDAPVRLDFFGDEIDNITTFDPYTQARRETVSSVWVHPARQALVPSSDDAQDAVKTRLRAICDDVNMPTTQTSLFIEDMMEGRTFVGSHSFLPGLYPELDTLFDYLPQVHFCMTSFSTLKMALHKSVAQTEADFARKRELQVPAFDPRKLHCSEEEVSTCLAKYRTIRIHPFALEQGESSADDTAAAQYIDLETRGFRDLRQKLAVQAERSGALDIVDSLAEYLRELADNGYFVGLVVHSKGQADRLLEMLDHRDVAVVSTVSTEPGGPGVHLVRGELVSGFIWPAEGICYISEEEVFGKSATRKRGKSAPKDVFFDLTSLHPGDLVVHKEHGIGRYEGLVHREVRDVGMDFLLITYKGDDKLYLPIYRLSQIQKYKSATEKTVSLDKLGGIAFTKTKAAARKRAMLLAAKLLEIYARKELTTRQRVDDADDMYLAFEAAFPFEETHDQLNVIAEVSADLENARPMDRLLCGDVGFGKTEVALRAAFRIVNSGRQVALLVPTTVLAQQHYLQFRRRFSGYPVRVEMMSRFRSKGQNAKTVMGIKDGTVDIVVGTHRLLSNDVHFKNLGLLVIDEEHRFGVAHKERIRSLRTSVDTLAMTATPIPRTLHMAFSKLRDLSIISTPPVNRLPIKTMICHDDAALIREAIERELARDGQVYFVHNRVKDISRVAARVSHLVPQARIGIGHGQMKENALEQVMNDFMGGHYDVLVCTAIIESGLDIPRANTILIDRADTFGLAQLYQIRGRVGRSDQQAYAYLIVPPVQMLSDDAKERVEAMTRHTDLGSGFQVASMDLEIRGAGNILGSEQSGDVDGVGFEMYMELLEEATARLKGESYEVAFEPEINLDTPGFFPEEYIGDVGLRLHFYKELATSRTEFEVQETAATLVDRFGKLPNEVTQLVDGMVAKALCRQLGVLGLETTAKRITLHLGAQTRIQPQKVFDVIQQADGRVRLTPDYKILAVHDNKTESVTTAAIHLLRQLAK